jgi:hypothetical protein
MLGTIQVDSPWRRLSSSRIKWPRTQLAGFLSERKALLLNEIVHWERKHFTQLRPVSYAE